MSSPMDTDPGAKAKVSKRKSDYDESHQATMKKFAIREEDISPGPSMECLASGGDLLLPHISLWIDHFQAMLHDEQTAALSALVENCSLSHVRCLSNKIEPYFKKDFIANLPKELSLHILGLLPAADLLKCTRVSRYWRTMTEDHLLWRELCQEGGHTFESIPELPTQSSTSQTGAVFGRSPWKALYMRHQRVNKNWRRARVDPNEPVKMADPDPVVMRGHDEHVITCLQIHGDMIVSGSDDNTLRIWNAQTARCEHVLTGHSGGVWSSQLSSDGKVVVSGSTDRTVRVWCTQTGICKHTLIGHTSTVRCMALHGNNLVTGSRDTTLRMWNINTGECAHVLNGHVAAVRCVQFDGRRIVSGAYDYTLKVWDAHSWECLHTLGGHTNRVYSLILDPSTDIVVSGSLDTTIRVWNIEDGTLQHILIGHQSLTSGMSLRDNILVSGNADSTIKVWDVSDGSCKHTLAGQAKHTSAVTSLALLENGLLVTSSDDGTAKLWDTREGTFVRDLVRLESGGSGGCIWRLKATPTRLVCAVGSRNGTEDTKLLLLDFNAPYP